MTDDRRVAVPHRPPDPTRAHPRVAFGPQPTRVRRGIVADVGGIVKVVGRVVALFLLGGGAALLLGGGYVLFEARVCGDKADALAVDYRYTIPAGCFVQTRDGTYIPIANYQHPETP
jgi:hypothetical protein